LSIPRLPWLLTALAAATLAFPAHAATLRTLSIGFAPFENEAEVMKKAAPIVEVLSQSLGRPVRPFVSADYPAMVEAMRSGKLDVAFLSPAALVMAEKVAGVKVILKSVFKGRSAYYSAIFTRADSRFHSLKDLKGHTFAFVDPGSTSGGVYPKLMLMKAGINPDKDFSHVIYAGGHDAAVLAVFNHKVDAAATFANDTRGDDVSWKHILGKDAVQIRALAYSPPIPNGAIAVSKMLDAATVQKVRQTLLNLGKTEAGRKHLARFYLIDSFAPAVSSDYDPVREAFVKVGLKIK
jgi:phosphonate transport system substrate-binding protein